MLLLRALASSGFITLALGAFHFLSESTCFRRPAVARNACRIAARLNLGFQVPALADLGAPAAGRLHYSGDLQSTAPSSTGATMSSESKTEEGVGGTPVYLKVYDLSRGLASQISVPLLGFQMDGLWHTSIAVFGNEYLFGQGISFCEERRCEELTALPLSRRIRLGETHITKELFHQYIDSLSVTFSPESYHLLRWNCNHFTNHAAEFLTGQGIPDEYGKMVEKIEASPNGKLVLSMVEQSFNRNPGSFAVPTGRE